MDDFDFDRTASAVHRGATGEPAAKRHEGLSNSVIITNNNRISV